MPPLRAHRFTFRHRLGLERTVVVHATAARTAEKMAWLALGHGKWLHTLAARRTWVIMAVAVLGAAGELSEVAGI